MLVDSHCHLDMIAEHQDLDEVVGRARRAGVGTMVTISTTLSTWDRVREIAETYDDVWCSVGVHPHEAGPEGQSAPDKLIELAQHPRVVGIGESGLDYHYDNSPRQAQAESFRTHIVAARETGLPLIVHAREADADIARILREGYADGAYDCVMHCFSSGRALAEAALEMGFYISMSGIATFKKAEEVREVARLTPADKLLVETDAPYLAPQPKRGRPNEPSYVSYTADSLCDTLGLERAELEQRTSDNFFRLFDRAQRPDGG